MDLRTTYLKRRMTMRHLKLSLAIFLAGILVVGTIPFAFAINEPSFGAWENKNRASGDNHPVRVLKMVRFPIQSNNTASLVSGDAVVYSVASDDAVTVLETTTSADATFAGIVCVEIPTADSTSTSFRDHRGGRNWGWIVVHGPANASVTAGGTKVHSAGGPLITSTDTGVVTTYVNETASPLDK